MSMNTPRTNACLREARDEGDFIAHCRTLERELDVATKRIVMLDACLKSWKQDEGADAKRFEWLLDRAGTGINCDPFPSREEIDAAMQSRNSTHMKSLT